MIIPYLLGSINPAIIISKLVYHDDIRTHGSGNAGSTNMLRTFGKKAAIITFICDMLKTVFSMLLGMLLMGQFGMAIAGFFAGFGHMFPLYYRFKGGKGVACYATVALMLHPLVFLGMLFVFVVVLVGTRFVSLASIMGAIIYPFLMRAFAPTFPFGVAFAVVEACFVIFMHRENIKRIWNHKENQIDFSKFKKSNRNKKAAEEPAPEQSVSQEQNGGDHE
jgi:glycerol-3-phosphate acyltransferase PlsY